MHADFQLKRPLAVYWRGQSRRFAITKTLALGEVAISKEAVLIVFLNPLDRRDGFLDGLATGDGAVFTTGFTGAACTTFFSFTIMGGGFCTSL